MEVVTGAMGTLLPKLADLIKGEYNLQKRARDEITFLKTELEYMEPALRKVADSEAPAIDQTPPDELLKLWARDVRELSYDLEDCIDTFMARVVDGGDAPATHSFRTFMERCKDLLTRAKVRHNIGVEMEDFRRRIKEVHERQLRYNKADSVAAAKPLGPSADVRYRLSALYLEETKLVGTEQKIGEVVKLLMEGDEASKHHLKIVSIFGFGGLGKTTLAKLVYNKLTGEFDCGAFVFVTHTPNIKNILKSMLHQFGHPQYDATLEEEQLIKQLRDFLGDKRDADPSSGPELDQFMSRTQYARHLFCHGPERPLAA